MIMMCQRRLWHRNLFPIVLEPEKPTIKLPTGSVCSSGQLLAAFSHGGKDKRALEFLLYKL